jgi:hypothetical protein
MAGQSRLRSVLDAGSAAVSERRRRRRLAREIAAYRTPAERLELDLILSRHTAEEIQEIEKILRYQDASRAYTERLRANPGARV